ncbi:OprO/OprP family phosphate-selective porin [Litorimonas sp. RW-G-Af-16]|uniref:OprO/OprP family phosphate-selective porin n=1 Tax=Litorimonas sp. RW-G-Af-16 TaxID=3241168 RepID=UPI00390C92BB
MAHFLKGGVAASSLALVMAYASSSVAQDATLKIGGRVMLDYTFADVNDPDSSINDIEARRVRLNATGKYGSAVSYKVELNKTGDKAINVEDAWIQFSPENSKFKIKVGQFQTQNSLDELTSSRFSSTLERAAFTDAFGFNRRLGVGVSTSGDNYTVDAGVFTDNLGGPDFDSVGNTVNLRGTYNPVKTDETLVHLGASWRYRNGSDSDDSAVNDGIRYRQRPYTHIAPSRIITTQRFAKSDNFIGAEAAVIHNQFWASGEYSVMKANGAATNPDANFGGYYGEVGVFIGGKKGYKGGKFNRPIVDNPLGEGGFGAFSFVARYDSVDLQDEIYLGKLDTVILGADWWPTKQTRLGINYFDADAENGSAESANGFVARLGFDF